MILRILSAIVGALMIGYGLYSAVKAAINPSLRMYLKQGGSDTVRIIGRDVEMSARLFVFLIWLFILLVVAGGFWFCSFAFRARGGDDAT